MGAFVRGCDALRQNFPACTVLVVHHTGYDKHHARGSTALKAALDTELELRRLGPPKGRLENLELTVAKMKNFANDGCPLYLKLVDVDVPAVTGLASTHSGVLRLAGARPKAERKENENEAKVMQALAMCPAGLTPKELRTASGVTNEDTCRDVLKRLGERDEVYKEGVRWFAREAA
jgi:hypothetical protein